MASRYLQPALGALLLISSLPLTSALVISSTLPGSWTSQGCYVDIGRTLTGPSYTNSTAMTEETCIAYCSKAGYIYAGTEYTDECYCGDSLNGAGTAAAGDCSMPCAGNATEQCGGPNRLNLFWSGTSGPQTNPGNGSWAFVGCYLEGTTGRTLPNEVTVTGGTAAMTVDLCTAACGTAGYPLAGLEYSQECWCGSAISNGGVLATDGLAGCSMLCNGNLSEYCGGSSHLDVYDFNGVVSLPPWTTVTSSSTSKTSSSVASTSVSLSKSSSTSTTSTKSSSSSSSSSSTSVRSTSTSSSVKPTSSSTTSSSSSSVKSTSSSTSSPSSVKSTSSTSSTKSTSSTSSSIKSTSSTSSSTSTVPTSTSKSSSVAPTTSSSSTSTPPSTSSTSTSTSTSASSSAAPTGPSIKPSVGAYNYYGCQTEATNIRALSLKSTAYDDMTLESCSTDCAGYTYFGTEYGRECYCGNSFNAGSVPAPTTDCSFPCGGNPLEYCGAGNRLSAYVLSGAASSSSFSSTSSSSSSSSSSSKISSSVSASSSTTSKPSTSSTSTSTSTQTSSSTTSTLSGIPTGWSPAGCWVDGVNGRILAFQQPDQTQTNTNELCIETCAALNYTIAGTEYSVECYCDDYIENGGVLATDPTTCNTPCSGNSAEMCGGGGRLTVYSTAPPGVKPIPAAQNTSLPGSWVYQGCLQDNVGQWWNGESYQPVRTFPYQIENYTNNTATSCLTQCQKFGYNAAGLEYAHECYCGDIQNMYTNNASFVDESGCDIPCSGNDDYLCGGLGLLTTYFWEGTPLYEWDFRIGVSAGEYSLLIGGLCVPLMTAQSVTGKVTFIEKHGSQPNGTGSYELDLTEIDNFDLAWRPLNPQTDVFCSAGLTLPDRAGRLIDVGGWSDPSTFGVRLYWPDGSPGVWGTNDWEEDYHTVHLQVARWYPSAMMMSNGSILVVGGEIGSNSDQQPNLEILPPTRGGLVFLDFLNRTNPNNLYPFLAIMPSGGIFIQYYNEARILDPVTFDTIKILPGVPCHVSQPDGGRSYPQEATMMLLPQYAPYTDLVTVLICGGSTVDYGDAIDNCVSTQPEAANPVWVIERMPSVRVMTCMTALPDGTYLILNGAQLGWAGFGKARNPNFNALLYDPTKPINSRISVMANTTVARMYHSEAILLADGRVMVSGSDPLDPVGGNPPYPQNPEEYRVEVFTPPYLLSGLIQPTFTIANRDWEYGQEYTFTVTLHQGTTSTLRVSLMGSVVSTHGNSMGQRTIFPAVSCTNGNTCTVTAPPNVNIAGGPGWFQMFVLDGPTPSVAQFVRIGGDPGELGNWPANNTEFQVPGLGPILV